MRYELCLPVPAMITTVVVTMGYLHTFCWVWLKSFFKSFKYNEEIKFNPAMVYGQTDLEQYPVHVHSFLFHE